MKLLAFVDLHGNMAALKRLEEKNSAYQPDAIVCAGDITSFQNNIHCILSRLNSFNKPVFIVPGNHEQDEELRMACIPYKNIKYIHSCAFQLNNVFFFGYGGGGFISIDDEFTKIARQFEKQLNSAQKSIVIVHAPPHNTRLDLIETYHNGNKSISDFIKRVQPSLVVCGHFHENKGMQDNIGKTTIVNPGPDGRIIEI